MDCPSCGRFNTEAALLCECGFELTSDDAEEVRERRETSQSVRRAIFPAVALIGALFIAYYQWQDWTFASAAAGLGLRGDAPLPVLLILSLAVAGWAAYKLWRSVRAIS